MAPPRKERRKPCGRLSRSTIRPGSLEFYVSVYQGDYDRIAVSFADLLSKMLGLKRGAATKRL